MSAQDNSVADVQHRLEVLWHKLEQQGDYVSANTVYLAQQLITQLTDVNPPILPRDWETSYPKHG